MLSAAITKRYQAPTTGTKFLIISDSVTVYFTVTAHMRGCFYYFLLRGFGVLFSACKPVLV
jgi:hypothetical protein